jgi:hypothetical protein
MAGAVPANLSFGRDLTIRRKIENGRYYCALGRSNQKPPPRRCTKPFMRILTGRRSVSMSVRGSMPDTDRGKIAGCQPPPVSIHRCAKWCGRSCSHPIVGWRTAVGNRSRLLFRRLPRLLVVIRYSRAVGVGGVSASSKKYGSVKVDSFGPSGKLTVEAVLTTPSPRRPINSLNKWVK